MNIKIIGNNLRNIMKARLCTQKALADALGITFQQIQKYQSGKNRMSADTLFAAAKYLKTEVKDFFAGCK